MTPAEHLEAAERLLPWVHRAANLADRATRIPYVGHHLACRLHDVHLTLHRRWAGHVDAAAAETSTTLAQMLEYEAGDGR